MTSRPSPRNPKILCVRLDKIGDLVSTLPVDEVLKSAFPSADVQWVIAKGLGFLAEFAEPTRQAFEVELSSLGREQFRTYLKTEKPDAVVIFYAPWWASYECARAGIPLRIGRRSQWFSYLFYSAGLRQGRSRSEKHEADYNLELMEFAVSKLQERFESPRATPSSASPQNLAPTLQLKAPLLRQLLEKFDVRRNDFIVVHPGMAGSALNWPVNSYIELIRGILRKDLTTKVVITGTRMDMAWTEPVLKAFQSEKRVISAVESLNLKELLYLIEQARVVVVPSTGVAHLAASLGRPTRALYSPVRAHSSKRWGPRGPQVQIFEAEFSQGGVDPMTSITVDAVLASLPAGTT